MILMNLTRAQEKLLRSVPLEDGKRYKMTSGGDYGIDPDARPFSGQEVTVVKRLKSGLYQTQLPDGRTYAFPKRALWPIEGETYAFLEPVKEEA